MVNSVCIANLLSFVMDYACPLYDRFRQPWNWVAYVPLLAGISVFGILLSAVLLYLMSNAGTTHPSLLRSMAPFRMVVSMTVGIVSYAVVRIQMPLRERNVQLETLLLAKLASSVNRSRSYPAPPPDPTGPPVQVHPATARHSGGRCLAAGQCR